MSAPFDPKDEQPIPHRLTAAAAAKAAPALPKEVRRYVIGMHAEHGKISFFFTERPHQPDPTGDGPLELRVPANCTLEICLDHRWNWEFRQDNAVMLGPMNYPEDPRYFNLEHVVENGHCRKVRFDAQLLGTKDPKNRDPYAFYVNLLKQASNGQFETEMMLRIDPDIINTGERPN